jgi:hypothetical protein
MRELLLTRRYHQTVSPSICFAVCGSITATVAYIPQQNLFPRSRGLTPRSLRTGPGTALIPLSAFAHPGTCSPVPESHSLIE